MKRIMGNKSDREKQKASHLHPPKTLSETGLKMYREALSTPVSKAGEKNKRYKDTERAIADSIRSSKTKWDFVQCLLKFREELSHIRLGAPEVVSKKQIQARPRQRAMSQMRAVSLVKKVTRLMEAYVLRLIFVKMLIVARGHA